MGVWEGKLVVFESLVNQQIHPLSLQLSLSPLPPHPFFLPLPLLFNNMGSASGYEKLHTREGEGETGERDGQN